MFWIAVKFEYDFQVGGITLNKVSFISLFNLFVYLKKKKKKKKKLVLNNEFYILIEIFYTPYLKVK